MQNIWLKLRIPVKECVVHRPASKVVQAALKLGTQAQKSCTYVYNIGTRYIVGPCKFPVGNKLAPKVIREVLVFPEA